MKTEKDLTNMIFGKWTVIKFDSVKNYFSYWLCKCDCGKIKPVSYDSLIKGKSKGCGHIDDLSGKRFGNLLVKSYLSSDKDGHSIWLCECDCGKKTNVNRSELLNGDTISCGCFRRKKSSITALDTYQKYKNNFKYHWYFYDDSNNKIKCASSYEVLFWNYFYHIKKEDILYEPNTFLLLSYKRYTPDFYFPKTNLWIDTKGSYNLFHNKYKQEEKIIDFSKNNNIKIYFWKDICEACSLPFKCFDTYKNRAKKIGMVLEDYLANMLYYNGDFYANKSKTIQE